MKLTNNLGLPQAIFNAIAKDPYNKGAADFSITELISPARQRALMKIYDEDLEEDVADRLWSLYGQIAHGILERAGENAIVETRLFGKFGRYTISGAIDSLCLVDGTLQDYKFTTSYSFMAGKKPKDEWTQQLNMQLELLRMNGMDANRLEIIGLLRDWQLAKFKEDPNYPQTQIAKHEIPIWPREKTVAFFRERIVAHAKARAAVREDIEACTKKETWYGRRCESYCAVNKFCDQYQKERRPNE